MSVVSSGMAQWLFSSMTVAGSLRVPTMHAVGSGHAAPLVPADFDADGRVDLATSDWGSNSVSVLIADAFASFPPAAARHALSSGLGSLLGADIDGVGAIDLAGTTWYESRDAVVLFGSLAGPLGEETRIPLAGNLGQLIAVDLTGDAKKDLLATVVTSEQAGMAGGLSLLVSEGGRGIRNTFFPAPSQYIPFGVVDTDLDGDDRLDLVLTEVVLSSGLLRFTPVFNVRVALSGQDANQNAIPDECEQVPRPLFHRGDPNGSGATDISDAVAIFGHLFLGDAAPGCFESADAQNDGRVDISDGIYLLSWLFSGGETPAPPGPRPAPCDSDSDTPGGPGDLGCVAYSQCE